ncbi:MAG TPA: GtrA family protein [Polyangia bacterium]|jgi:putative flippase GtrA|nr:GtrA family protein [Polyangia bacterium]
MSRIPRTLPRSILTSLLTTALDFGVLTGAVELFHVNYVLATWFGTVVGSLSNFAINKRWAFRGSPLALRHQFLRFLLVQGGASGLHTLGVWLLTRFAGLPYLGSKTVIASLVALGWNYPMNRLFVFSRHHGDDLPGAR